MNLFDIYKAWQAEKAKRPKKCRHEYEQLEYCSVSGVEYRGLECTLCKHRKVSINGADYMVNDSLRTMFQRWKMKQVYSIQTIKKNGGFTIEYYETGKKA